MRRVAPSSHGHASAALMLVPFKAIAHCAERVRSISMKLPIPSYPGLTPADLRAQCGYAHPPPELELPHFREDPDGMAYVALREWFRRQGVDEYDGLACYLAHKFSVD